MLLIHVCSLYAASAEHRVATEFGKLKICLTICRVEVGRC